MRQIDMTPTWVGVLPILLLALESGTAEGKKAAREELMQLAKAADENNARARAERQRRSCPHCGEPDLDNKIEENMMDGGQEIEDGEERTDALCPKCDRKIVAVRTLELDRIERGE